MLAALQQPETINLDDQLLNCLAQLITLPNVVHRMLWNVVDADGFTKDVIIFGKGDNAWSEVELLQSVTYH